VIITPRSPKEQGEWLAYLAKRVGGEPADIIGDMPYGIYGVIRWGRLVGVVLWTNFRDHSIEAAWAGEPGWLTRETLRQIWAYPFLQLKVRVVTGLVKASNARSQSIAERMGCVRCGVIPRWYEDDDAVIYAMTAEHCRWIDGKEEPEGAGRDADCEPAVQHEQAGRPGQPQNERDGSDQRVWLVHLHA